LAGTSDPGENKALLQKPICICPTDYLKKLPKGEKLKSWRKQLEEKMN
jgi:hypothetical protein